MQPKAFCLSVRQRFVLASWLLVGSLSLYHGAGAGFSFGNLFFFFLDSFFMPLPTTHDGDGDDTVAGLLQGSRFWFADRGVSQSDLERAMDHAADTTLDTEHGVERPGKRQRCGGSCGSGSADAAQEEAQSPGPRTYEDCLRFAKYHVESMLSLVSPQDILEEDGIFSQQFVLTTDYSGMGCPEIASDLVMDPSADVGAFDPPPPGPHASHFQPACLLRLRAQRREPFPSSGPGQAHLPAFRIRSELDRFHAESRAIGSSRLRHTSSPFVSQDALREQKLLDDERSRSSKDFLLKYRSSDVDESCRAILLSHEGEAHVQGDILERIGREHLAKLRQILQEHVSDFIEAMQVAERDGPVTAKITNILRRDIGQACLEKLRCYLAEQEESDDIFDHEAFCYRCKRRCPVHPPEEVRGKRSYINIGGNVCVPWSCMNQSAKAQAKGWLSEYTLLMIVWLFDLRRRSVTFLVQECTSMFDILGYRRILQDMFYIEQVKFSPLELGIPAHRLRSYTLSVNKSQIVMRVPFTKRCLEENFFKKMVTTAEIFFRAPESYVQAYLLSLVNVVRGSSHASSLMGKKSWDIHPESYLTVAQEIHLRRQKQTGQKKGLPFLCCNVTQTDDFMKFDSSCPCILRHAKIFGQNFGMEAAGSTPRISRLMTPYEHLAAQGLPVLLSHRHRFTTFLPKLMAYAVVQSGRGLPAATLSTLSGNGMHLSQVGLCLLFCFLGAAPLPNSTSDIE